MLKLSVVDLLSMRCYSQIFPTSEAADIAATYLRGKYHFVEPSRLDIEVVQVRYVNSLWSARLRVANDDPSSSCRYT